MPEPPSYKDWAHQSLEQAQDRIPSIIEGDESPEELEAALRWAQGLANAVTYAILDVSQAIDARGEELRELRQRIEHLGPIAVSPVHPGAI